MQYINIFVLWFSLFFDRAVQKDYFEESVFDSEFCNIFCPNNQVHTMCGKKNEKACDNFQLTVFEKKTDSEPLMRLIVDGHNGLRNRIAEKMSVPNMLELTWDKKLAAMAENFLKLCTEKATDSCAFFCETVKEEDTFAGFYKNNFSYAQIVQNIYSEKAAYYPYKFIERVIRSWYFEKEGMREPIYSTKNGITYGRLMGENNFTHFASPLTFRFGCGMASFKGSYHLVCNYYPYYRTSTNTMYFSSGSPVSNCPAKFPMMDEMYTNLCTADIESYFDNISSSLHVNACFRIFYIFLIWLSSFLRIFL